MLGQHERPDENGQRRCPPDMWHHNLDSPFYVGWDLELRRGAMEFLHSMSRQAPMIYIRPRNWRERIAEQQAEEHERREELGLNEDINDVLY